MFTNMTTVLRNSLLMPNIITFVTTPTSLFLIMGNILFRLPKERPTRTEQLLVIVCKRIRHGGQPRSPDAKPHVADGFAAETLFKFAQDFGLGDLFELVMKRGLKNANVEYAFTQRDRG